MIKTNSNFKLNKQVKRFMATMIDPVQRHAFKNAMIQAQLSGSKEIEKKKKRSNETEAT
jgi:hypothetical protein